MVCVVSVFIFLTFCASIISSSGGLSRTLITVSHVNSGLPRLSQLSMTRAKHSTQLWTGNVSSSDNGISSRIPNSFHLLGIWLPTWVKKADWESGDWGIGFKRESAWGKFKSICGSCQLLYYKTVVDMTCNGHQCNTFKNQTVFFYDCKLAHKSIIN